MIQNFVRQVITPRYTYENDLDNERARALIIFFAITFLTAILTNIALFSIGFFNDTSTFGIVVTLSSPIAVIVFYEMVQRGFYRLATILIIGFTTVTALQPIIAGSGINENVLTIIIPVVLAGTLLGWRSVLLVNVIVFTALLQRTFLQPIATGEARPILAFVTVSLITLTISLVLVIFGSNIRQSAERFVERFNILKRVASSLNLPSDNSNEADLVARVIDIMRDDLDYNYAQVFLANESLEIRRRIASGLSKEQVNVDTGIILNDGSAIYEALRRREVIMIDRASNEVRRAHLLPGLQTGIAIPLKYNDRAIGVLDVQSESQSQPSQTEIEVIEVVADQLATSLSESRIIADLRETLNQQDNLIQRQQARLLEYERLQRRGVASNWATYLGQRGIEYLGFDFNMNDTSPVEAFNLDPEMKPVIEAGEVTVEFEDSVQIVSAPILLRGQSLGAMSFKVPQGRQLISNRQLDLVRNVVQRLALALENQRLFEQSQAQAQRERKANEIGNLLLSTTDIETVLKLAVENFNEALGAVQTKIHLQPDAQTSAKEIE